MFVLMKTLKESSEAYYVTSKRYHHPPEGKSADRISPSTICRAMEERDAKAVSEEKHLVRFSLNQSTDKRRATWTTHLHVQRTRRHIPARGSHCKSASTVEISPRLEYSTRRQRRLKICTTTSITVFISRG